MSDSTIVLITGASRSLGKALVQTYLSRPNHIVVGSVRDKASPNAQELNTLPPAAGSRLFLVGWTELGDHVSIPYQDISAIFSVPLIADSIVGLRTAVTNG
ncbi:hypothetical protein V1520DRAFT_349939 [Lipomyces starkeyi]